MHSKPSALNAPNLNPQLKMKNLIAWAMLTLSVSAQTNNVTTNTLGEKVGTKVVNGVKVTTITSPKSTNTQPFVYGKQKLVHPDDQKPLPQPDQPNFRIQATPEFEHTSSTPVPEPRGPYQDNYGFSRNVWNPNYAYGSRWYNGNGGYERRSYLGSWINVESNTYIQSQGGGYNRPRWEYVPVIPGYTIQTQGTNQRGGGSSGSTFNSNYAGSSANNGDSPPTGSSSSSGNVWNSNYATTRK